MSITKTVWHDGGTLVYRADGRRLSVPVKNHPRLTLEEAKALGASQLSKLAGMRWVS